jgi:hypothetical protein
LEEGLKVNGELYYVFEDLGNIEQEMNGSADQSKVEITAINFNLESIIKGHDEQYETGEVAEELFTVSSVGLSQLVCGDVSVDFLGSSQDIINASEHLNCESAIEALFEYFDELVFVVVVMFDNFVFDSSQDESNGEVNCADHKNCDEDVGPSCTDYNYRNYQNHDVLVNPQHTVACDKYLLVILD